MTSKKKNFTISLIIAMFFLTFFFIYNIIRAIYSTQQKIEDYKRAQLETEALREQYFQTYIKTQQVNTDSYLEKFSRDELNYAKDGDIIFIIDKSQLDNPIINDEYAKIIAKSNSQTKNAFQEWLKFFKNGI